MTSVSQLIGSAAGRSFRFALLGCLLVLVGLVWPQAARATHVMGGDIVYTWQGGLTYLIEVTFYFDCSGSAGAIRDFGYLRISSATANFNQDYCMTRDPNSGQEVSALCGASLPQSTCTNPNGIYRGAREYRYFLTVTLPSARTDWVFRYADPARNTSSNINNSGNTVFIIEARLDNLNNPGNNSTRFTTLPVPYTCLGATFNFNHGAVDPDSDSLAFSLVAPVSAAQATFGGNNCSQNNNQPRTNWNTLGVVAYLSGFSPTNPMATTGGFSFNTASGQMSAFPSAAQNPIIAIRIDEWKFDPAINARRWAGSTMREMQVVVVPNCQNASPSNPGLNNLTGIVGTQTSTQGIVINSCLDEFVQFSFDITDPDIVAGVPDSVFITTNIGTSFSVAGFSSTPGNPARATVTFIATQNEIGSNFFTVTARDNGCALSVQQIYSFEVRVSPISQVRRYPFSVSQPACAGQPVTVQYTGSVPLPDTSFIWNFAPGVVLSGTGGGPYQVLYPNPGTYSIRMGLRYQGCRSLDSVFTFTIQKPSATVNSQNQVSCPGGSDGLVNLVGTGGTAPYRFGRTRSNITSTGLLSGFTAGTHWVYVRDGNGCLDSLQVTLTTKPALQGSASADTTICRGGTANMRATASLGHGTYTYTWRQLGQTTVLGTSSTLSVSPNNTTSYTVTIADGCGATTQRLDTVVVTVFPVLNVTAPAGQTLCAGDTVTLSPTVTGGAGRITYEWRQGGNTIGTTPSLTVSPTGTTTYTVIVTDTCGPISRNVTVTVRPQNLAVTLSRTPTGTVCPGSNVTVTLGGTGGAAPYTFSWSDGNTQNPRTFVVNDTLRITGTVTDLCQSRDTLITLVSFKPLEVTALRDTIICPSGTGTLGAGATGGNPPYAYTWSVVGGTTLGAGQTRNVNPSATTRYAVAVTDACGTVARDTMEVELFNTFDVTPLADTTACFGQPLTLSTQLVGGAGLSLSYTWTNSAGTVLGTGPSLTFTATTTDTYSVSVLSQCGGTPVVKSAVVIVIPPTLSIANLAYSLPAPYCPGSLVTITPTVTGGTGTYTYEWSAASINPAVTTPTLSVFVPDSILVALRVQDGCQTRDTLIALNTWPDLVVTARNDTTVCPSTAATLRATPTGGNGSYSLTWLSATGAGLGSANPLAITPSGNTFYIARVVDGCGVEVRDTVNVTRFDTLIVEALADTTVCEGQLIRRTAVVPQGNPPYSYEWRDLGTGQVVGTGPTLNYAPADSTAIRLTVTDGCQSYPRTFAAHVIPNNLSIPSITAVPAPPYCPGTIVTVTATTSGGSGTYDFLWNNGQTGAVATYTVNDTLTASVTLQDGCTVRIDSLRLDTWPDLVIDATPELRTICVGESTSFAATVTGGDGSYQPIQWQTLAGVNLGSGPSLSFSPADTTIVVASVVDGCGVLARDTVVVHVTPRPVVTPGAVQAVCFGNAIQLQATIQSPPGYTVQWTPADFLSDPTSLNPITTPPGNITYRVQAFLNGCPGPVDSVQVVVNQLPRAVPDTSVYGFCVGEPGVQLRVQGAGGTAPYSFAWSPTFGLSNPNSPTPVAQPLVSTNYTVIVTDVNGCVSTPATVQVRVDSLPLANAGPNRVLCDKAQGVQLLGSGQDPLLGSGFSFQWSPSAGLNNPILQNPIARPNQTTTYTLTVTNTLTGCSSVNQSDPLAQVTVTVLPRPTAVAGPDTSICFGDSVRIGPKSTDPDARYFWSPSTGLEDSTFSRPLAGPAFTTTYFLTVERGGCLSVADSVTVTVKPLPTVAIEDEGLSTCPGTPIQLQSRVANFDPPLSYQWSPAAGLSNASSPNPIANPVQTTTYYLRVSGDGCASQAQDSITVYVLPIPSVDADTTSATNLRTICQGDTLQLPARIVGAQPYEYAWSPTTGLLDPTALRPLAAPSQTTTYYLTVRRGDCQTRDSITVRVTNSVTAQLSASPSQFCGREPVTLSAAGSLNFDQVEWFPTAGLTIVDAQTALAEPEQTTTYRIITRAGSCADTAYTTVTVFDPPVADFDFTPAPGCGPREVSFLNSSTGYTMLIWNFGDGSPVRNDLNPSHTYTQPGDYTVSLTLIGPGGCRDSISRQLGESFGFDAFTQLIVTTSAPAGRVLDFLPGANLTLSDLTPRAVSWLWVLSDGSSYTTPNVQHTFRQAGRYTATLTLTDAQGCAYDTLLGPWEVREPTLEVPNVFTPNGDGANDRWQVQYAGPERLEIAVMDRWGRLMYKGTADSPGWDGQDTQNQPAVEGVYFYLIEVGDKVYKGSITLIR